MEKLKEVMIQLASNISHAEFVELLKGSIENCEKGIITERELVVAVDAVVGARLEALTRRIMEGPRTLQ